MSAALPCDDRLASEQTPIGEQTLVYGVAPITPRDRLAIRASAPLEPRKAQRRADHGGAAQGSGDAKHRWNGCGGVFDTNARNQIEMF